MFANVERERERDRGWCRHIKVNIPSADLQVEREREREMCVFLLNFVSFCCCFFTLGTRLRTGQPRYLKVQGNGENTSSYPKFDIANM